MNNRDRIYFFAPNLKSENYLLEELKKTIENKNHIKFLSEIINGDYSVESKFAFSILNDILSVGGSCWLVNEKIFVHWPLWDGKDGRLVTKFALQQSIDSEDPYMKNLKKEIWDSHKEFFFDVIDKDKLLNVMQASSFELKEVEPTESVIFDICLKYWTMPVRSRPSRSKRFILWCMNNQFILGKKVVGILEIGDDAPMSNHRDEMLGLTYSSFKRWFESGSAEDRENRISKIHIKFTKLRDCLRLDNSYTISDILSQKKYKKYRSRIDAALSLFDPNNRDNKLLDSETNIDTLKESIKIIHNIVLPRIHCEVTICGSIPPFNEIYGGKMMIAFLGHHKIQSALISSESKILQMSFNLKSLNAILPNYGSLGITTKGLYSGHSPMYNNSILAGKNGQIKFLHLGNTNGDTTSFISSRSVMLARQLLQLRDNQLSNEWGSGGSLRQRTLVRSCSEVGLEQAILFAGIRRPVYGCCYVSNIHDVIWCDFSPKWKYDLEITSIGYSKYCYDFWSNKWLNKISAKPNKNLGTLYEAIQDRICND